MRGTAQPPIIVVPHQSDTRCTLLEVHWDESEPEHYQSHRLPRRFLRSSSDGSTTNAHARTSRHGSHKHRNAHSAVRSRAFCVATEGGSVAKQPVHTGTMHQWSHTKAAAAMPIRYLSFERGAKKTPRPAIHTFQRTTKPAHTRAARSAPKGRPARRSRSVPTTFALSHGDRVACRKTSIYHRRDDLRKGRRSMKSIERTDTRTAMLSRKEERRLRSKV